MVFVFTSSCVKICGKRQASLLQTIFSSCIVDLEKQLVPEGSLHLRVVLLENTVFEQ